MDQAVFAQRLKQLRAEKGVSQHEMSLKLGLTHNYIFNIESGMLKVTRVIQSCFKKADFRSLFVKILVNPSGLTAFYALIERKSALFKIFDLKARKFRGIFAQFEQSKATALQEQIGGKAPKYAALRQV